jgi:hypothetical protein
VMLAGRSGGRTRGTMAIVATGHGDGASMASVGMAISFPGSSSASRHGGGSDAACQGRRGRVTAR